MQHTNKYQFNLVESGDTFSPTPLNENMEKVEEVLGAVDTALDEKIAEAMTALGTGGSTCRIAQGSFAGSGYAARTITFDFKPLVVFLTCPQDSGGSTPVTTLIRPGNRGNGAVSAVTWSDRSVTYGDGTSHAFNISGYTVYYVALGVSND